jgi:sugar phosphate isomerase/epimerase
LIFNTKKHKQMTLDRRKFLKTTLAGTAAVALGSCRSAVALPAVIDQNATPSLAEKAELNIAFQEGIAPGANLNERFDFMERYGVVGFEPSGRRLRERVPEIREALSGRNIKVSAIVAGFDGFVISAEPEVRQRFTDTMQEIIIGAGELESSGVIFVPAFNAQVPVMPHTMETREYLCEHIGRLGDFAQKHGTTVIFEPLNRRETFYLRQVADSASICRDIDNPGVTCMGDFWHMTWEETCDMSAFLSAGKYLQHVHIASRRRRSMPGEDGEADNYVDGFRALKMLGYNKCVSFECGAQGDRNIVIPAALELLRKQWEEAVV